eukprot:TRINITY_DN12804_c0_g1_i1.p1 TRINITY_DN12804_c0_g1~~TRINITY_DN12804_c0_g1_i1.p1  ORF type:complete len:233 (+),score=52.11 TRINITY_DN12804_c0_g1_i1:44-742(+)
MLGVAIYRAGACASVLVLLLAAISAVHAAAPTAVEPCCAPSQFEGISAQWDPREKFHRNAQISYDAVNSRVSVKWNQRVREVSHLFNAIFLYNQKTLYFVDENHTGEHVFKCEKHVLNEQFPLDCVPTDALYEGSRTLAGNQLLVDVWSFQTQSFNNQTIKAFDMRSRNGCWQVAGLNRSHRFGLDFHMMWDLTSGIQNPNVFVPPKECTNAPIKNGFNSLQQVWKLAQGLN